MSACNFDRIGVFQSQIADHSSKRSQVNVPRTIDAQQRRSDSAPLTMVSLCRFHGATVTSHSRGVASAWACLPGARRAVTGGLVSQRPVPPLLQHLRRVPVVACAPECGDAEPSTSDGSWGIVPTSSSLRISGASAAMRFLRNVLGRTTDRDDLRGETAPSPKRS